MYYVVGRIIKDGKAIGFRCIYMDNRSKTKEVNLSNKSIDRLIAKGTVIDISKNKRGYYFKDKERYISDLEKYSISAIEEERNKLNDIKNSKGGGRKMINRAGQQSKAITREEFTGRELKRYIESLGYKQEISKIKHLKKFLDTKELYDGNCFIITGMKRTGKTVLVEQGIRYLLNKGVPAKEILLIQYKSVNDNVDYEIDKLVEHINKTKCKYIFIDEITMLREFVSRSKGITDYTCKTGDKRVVLSGSDTLAFTLAETEYLNNRCYKLSTTVLEYKDWYNITKESLSGQTLSIEDKFKILFEYISDCTLNNYSYYRNNRVMYGYLMEAIAKNVLNSINKNTVYNCSLINGIEFNSIKEGKVLFIFYLICYDVIHHKVAGNKLSGQDININKNIGSLTKSIKDKSSIKKNKSKIADLVLSDLGVGGKKGERNITEAEYETILDMMISVGIIVECKVYNSGEYIEKLKIGNTPEEVKSNREYILTVPSIYSRFIDSIFETCKDYYAKLDEEVQAADRNDIYGTTFEAMIMVQILEYVYEYRPELEDRVRELRIQENKEIDIMVYPNEVLSIKGCMYDIKLSNKAHQRHFKSFDSEIMERYRDVIKSGHAGIIYTGETVTLKNGLVAINAHDFLMDIGKYIS